MTPGAIADTLAGCLHAPAIPRALQFLGSGTFLALSKTILMGLLVAAVLAPVLQWRYRLRIVDLMRLEAVGDPVASRAPTGQAVERLLPVSDITPAVALRMHAAEQSQRILRAGLTAWLTWVALAAGVAWLDADAPAAQHAAFLALAAILGVGPLQHSLPPSSAWGRRSQIILSLAVGATAVVFTNVLYGAESWGDAIAFGVLLVIAHWALFDRVVRGQVLPILTLLVFAALTLLLAYGWTERLAGACLAWARGPGAPWLAHYATDLAMQALPMLGLFLGFRAIDGAVLLLRRRWLGEMALTSLTVLGVWSILLVAAWSPDDPTGEHAAWVLVAPAWLAGTAAAYRLALGRSRPRGRAPQLLLLRVFSGDRARHDLLDELQARWRLFGPVHQIGGPDLVARNVDPLEASMFLGNRLHELFLPPQPDLAAVAASLELTPDRDGRYRINEVFCTSAAWQEVVVDLMCLSDLVVLDLRGLHAGRTGTGFELHELGRLQRLQQVVALGDDTTDWGHADAQLRQAGANPALLQRMVCDGAVDPRHAADRLVTLLLERLAPTGQDIRAAACAGQQGSAVKRPQP